MKQTDKIIQSKLKDHEVDVPSGLWDEIERRLPRQEPNVPVWKKYTRYAAAAAFVSVCFLGGYLLLSPHSAPNIVAEQAAADSVAKPQHDKSHTASQQNDKEYFNAEAQVPPQEGHEVSVPTHTEGIRQIELLANAKETAPSNTNIAPTISPSSQSYPGHDTNETTMEINDGKERSIKADEENEDTKKDAPTSYRTYASSTSNTHYALATTAQKNSTEGLNSSYALSLSSTNAISATQYAQDTRMTRSSLYYAEEGSILKYRHKVPISVGITVEKQFGSHWGIESGLVYTFLRSDYKTETLQREGKQELHYLGIPLLARYRFFNTRLFSFYVSAGPQMDFNIYGRRTDDTYSHLAYSTYTENIRDHRVQWSAHLKLGVSYIISRHFDLYAEPAVAYFFDNGNKNIENLWKDKPINFAFHLGLRTKF